MVSTARIASASPSRLLGAAAATTQEADQRGEGRGLGAHAHEGRHRRRRALVDVGRPHVEGHQARP